MFSNSTRSLLVAAGALLGSCLGAGAGEPAVEQLVRELSGVAPAETRSAEELAGAYRQVVDALLGGLASDDLATRQKAQSTLEDIVLRSGRPGAEAERAACSQALLPKLSGDQPPVARVWIIRLLEEAGGPEAVEGLAALLDDPDQEIRESARRALARNPSPAATAALRGALARAGDPAWRIGMIDALASRGDQESVDTFAGLLDDPDLGVARAAAAALAELGGRAATAAVALARADARPELKPYLDDAYLRMADELLAGGGRRAAAAIYERLYAADQSRAIRQAALQGLARARGARALPALLAAVEGADAPLRGTAARLMVDLPGPNVTRTLAARLPALPTASQALVLGALGDRGDPSVIEAIASALQADSEEVRMAAVRALVALGGPPVVAPLAQAAARGEGDLRQAARQGLTRLAGAEVDTAIVGALGEAPPPVRAELVGALGARRVVAAVPALARIAAGDTSSDVRCAALRAIAELARPSHLPDLLAVTGNVQGEAEMAALEGALAAALRSIGDPDQRAAPLIQGLSTTAGQGRLVLLRCLGATGSEQALAALREAIAASDVATQEAAVRGLAAWPDSRVLEDLRQIAAGDASSPVRQAAFAAYVRALALPSERDSAQTVELYRGALQMAADVDQKKLVLANLAAAPSLGTLQLAQEAQATAPELAPDAARAAVDVGAAIAGAYPAETEEAMQKVLAAVADEGLRRRASDVIARIHKNSDMITAWQLAGPYTAEGKSGGDLFDISFPPEDPAAADVAWRLAPPAEESGALDLQNTDMRGDNRAAYLRAQLFSPAEQPVVLSVGSDDGVKLWLNGQVVHANNATRGHSLDQDRAEARLTEGWNTLLVKVVNGGADWAASVRVRRADGGLVEGLKVRAE